MLIVSLFLTLLFLLLCAYYVYNKNLLHPVVIILFILTFSALWAVIGVDYFGIDISYLTYFTIVLSIIFWAIGDLIAHFIFFKYKKKWSLRENVSKYEFSPSMVFILFSSLIVLFVCIKYMERFIYIGQHMGGDNFIAYYGLARRYTTEVQDHIHPDYWLPVGKFVVILNIVSRNLSLALVYIFLYNNIFFKKVKKRLLLPFLLYIPVTIFTTGRFALFRMVLIIAILYILLRYQKLGWGKGNGYLIKKIAKFGVIFVIIFYSLGFVRSNGVKVTKDQIFASFCTYFGSQIYGLNHVLVNPIDQSEYFAQETIPILYVILKKFEYYIPMKPLNAKSWSWKNGYSNTYTALKKPINDFGIIGMLITRIFLGLIYGIIIRKRMFVDKDILSSTSSIFFGVLIFPLFFYSFADLFYQIIQLDTVITVSFLFLFDQFYLKRNLNVSIRPTHLARHSQTL